MRGPKIERAATVRLQLPVREGKCKYIAETVMRHAFTNVIAPTETHKLVPVVLRALRSNLGLRSMPGWYVDRANKRKRRR